MARSVPSALTETLPGEVKGTLTNGAKQLSSRCFPGTPMCDRTATSLPGFGGGTCGPGSERPSRLYRGLTDAGHGHFGPPMCGCTYRARRQVVNVGQPLPGHVARPLPVLGGGSPPSSSSPIRVAGIVTGWRPEDPWSSSLNLKTRGATTPMRRSFRGSTRRATISMRPPRMPRRPWTFTSRGCGKRVDPWRWGSSVVSFRCRLDRTAARRLWRRACCCPRETWLGRGAPTRKPCAPPASGPHGTVGRSTSPGDQARDARWDSARRRYWT